MKNYNAHGEENINYVKEVFNAFFTVIMFFLFVSFIVFAVYFIVPSKKVEPVKKDKIELKSQKGNINGIQPKKLERIDENTFKTSDGEVIRLY